MFSCDVCSETWDVGRGDCPLCGSTEIRGTAKKEGGGRKAGADIELLPLGAPAPLEVFEKQRSMQWDILFESDPECPLQYPTRMNLGAKEWEAVTLDAINLEEKHDTLTGNRYGVDCRPMPSQRHPGEIEWQPVQSLPDFEGILSGGRQFVIENKKVSSRKSLPLNDDKFKKRQLSHLLKRDQFGGIAILLVHFNPRQLKKETTDSETFAMPVSSKHPFWRDVDVGTVKSLSPEDAAMWGYRVPWGTKYRSRTVRPLILETINAIESMQAAGWPEMEEANELPEAALPPF